MDLFGGGRWAAFISADTTGERALMECVVTVGVGLCHCPAVRESGEDGVGEEAG